MQTYTLQLYNVFKELKFWFLNNKKAGVLSLNVREVFQNESMDQNFILCFWLFVIKLYNLKHPKSLKSNGSIKTFATTT